MSLEPSWSSTIYGVYAFAGAFLSALAATILVVIHLRRTGPLDGIATDEHLHDLGRLLFAFATFWMYIWFSQYMLIWYGNIPEEALYFTRRMQGAWTPLVHAVIVLNWVIPFLALMPRAAKRSPTVLARVAALVLAGRALDIYVMIAPPVMGEVPRLGAWEAGVALGCLGLAPLLVLRALASAPPVPERDPSLPESLGHHS
jgi:hypothetical protein